VRHVASYITAILRSLVLALLVTPAALAADAPFEVPTWLYPGNPTVAAANTPDPPSTRLLHVAGSNRGFTREQIADRFSAPDWNPSGHPAMPEIVAHGRKPDVYACAYCHLPNGLGRPENASLAGLSPQYIEQQLQDFARGDRRCPCSQPYVPSQLMMQLAPHVDPLESVDAARYFASLRYRRHTEIVEVDRVPRTEERLFIHVIAPGRDDEMLGQRVIEVPIDFEKHELRDTEARYRAYVPQGSITRGRTIVESGMGGLTLRCTSCHGAKLQGVHPAPAIAGRSPTYLLRQLVAFRTGARNTIRGQPMRIVVERMTLDDMIAVSAYAASLTP
jgi:cytochrome c553